MADQVIASFGGLGPFGRDDPGGAGLAGGAVGRQKIAQSLGQIAARGDHAGGAGGPQTAKDRAIGAGTGAVEDGRAEGGRLHRVAGAAGAIQAAAQKGDGGEAIPQAVFAGVGDINLCLGIGVLIEAAQGDTPALFRL